MIFRLKYHRESVCRSLPILSRINQIRAGNVFIEAMRRKREGTHIYTKIYRIYTHTHAISGADLSKNFQRNDADPR